jgi:alanyl-tRNA synthetase
VEGGLKIEQGGVDAAMAEQRAKARKAWAEMKGEEAGVVAEILEAGIVSEFTGYETLEDSGTIKAIIKDGKRVDSAEAGERIEIVTDRTPFYGESGGQVGDHGTISLNGHEIEVEDAVRPLPDLIVHRGRVTSGAFRVGDPVNLKVDTDVRISVMANHSATHLLQWALREVLGNHVKQSGSLVESRRLRFDFTHFSSISKEELHRVEDLVNGKIRENVDVEVRTMSFDEARSEGATALFGEKYGDTVRMVSIGGFSKELCGGTHISRSGDIGFFKITAEGGIAAGVRRIEAVTGEGAADYVRALEEEISEVAARLKGSPGELVAKLEKLIEEKKAKEKEIQALKRRLASDRTTDILEGIREINGVKVLSKLVEEVSSPKDLRDFADRVRDRLGSGVALLGAESDGKAILIAVVTKDLVDGFHAGNIVKKAAKIVGGSGGGRPDMAQAGGPQGDKVQAALDSIEDFLG